MYHSCTIYAVIRYVSRSEAMLGVVGVEEPAVLLSSSTGVLQVGPTSGDPNATQILYAPLQERKEHVTASAVSKSGRCHL